MPSGFDLVIITSRVCRKISSSTKNLFAPAFTAALERALNIIIIASAAAVASSRRDALAICIPVMSMIMV